MSELANKAAEIRKRFNEVTEEWKLLMLPKNAGKRKRIPLPLVRNRETGPLAVESDVLGREEEKDMLVEWLLSEDDTTRNGVSVIAIVGMGGVGKTTLAQLVYNDDRVKSYFDLTGWVYVSENFDVVGLTKKILRSFTKVKIHEELDRLQRALQENLLGKRFLLVLDDVWNENFCLWEQLKKPLLWATAGKVIVTTRNHSVARIMQTTRHSLKLNVLPFDVCWSLFKKVTLGGADKSIRPDLEDIGRKIVEKCKGLPLAVELIGGALRNEEDEDSWTDIIESEIWELGERNIEVLPALQISYDCMPIQLKRCFQFLCLFPKDRYLYSEEIVRLWMSQGVLLDGDKREEDVGNTCIKRLAERSMLQAVDVNDIDEDDIDKTFSMHDLVHDLSQYVAKDECLCVIDNQFNEKKLQKIRHLSMVAKRYEKPIEIEAFQELKLLRSLFIVGQDRLCRVLDDLFQKLKCIRALALIDSSITELPDSLGNLKLLRYLSIRYIKIRSLPESVCNLHNLQTLDLDSTQICELPWQIVSLINLRHLWLPYTLDFLPSGIGSLTNLQTLNYLKVSCETEHCDIGEFNSLIKLGGHISISNVASVKIFSNSKPPLKTKRHLDSLALFWGPDILDHFDSSEEDEKKAEWQLEYLEPYVNLKTLEMINYPGVRFVAWVGDSSFTKLTRLTLLNCKNVNKLPPLGQLPALEILKMIGMDGVRHLGREFCSMLMATPPSSRNGIAFLSLKHLEFSRMPNWEAWDGVEIGDFPSLHFIEISECDKLIKFPRWPFVYSVKEMRLGSCGALDVPNLHSLTNLKIDVRTQEHSEWMSNCYLPTLQHLTLNSRVESVHLSQEGLPSLKILQISSSPALRAVAGLKNLTSLNSLIIEECPNLEFKKLPATLRQVKLDDCPLFEKGFKKNKTKQQNMSNVSMREAHDFDDDKGEEMEIEELMELNDVAIADRDGNNEEDGYDNDHYDSKHGG